MVSHWVAEGMQGVAFGRAADGPKRYSTAASLPRGGELRPAAPGNGKGAAWGATPRGAVFDCQ
jgi:hypothetical protein